MATPLHDRSRGSEADIAAATHMGGGIG
jgi:hypothetical protein